MAEKEFSELLKRLPEIAKAVNAFNSETVQREAFAELISALHGSVGAKPIGDDARTGGDSKADGATKIRSRKKESTTGSMRAAPLS